LIGLVLLSLLNYNESKTLNKFSIYKDLYKDAKETPTRFKP